MTRRRFVVPLVAACLLSACDKKPVPAPPAPAPPGPVVPPEPPLPPVEKTARLAVTATTWREGEKPWDVAAALADRLRRAGVGVDEKGADGVVTVAYEETKGEGYSSFGVGEPTSWGTKIACTLTVRRAGDAADALTFRFSGGTPYAVKENTGLFEAAVESVKRDELFQKSGALVAAALGMNSALPAILPFTVRLDTKDQVLPMFERAGWKPSKPEEEAWLLVARGEYERAGKLGGPAVPALAQAGVPALSAYEMLPIARALAATNDHAAAAALIGILDYPTSSLWNDENVKALVEFAIANVKRLGDASNVEALKQVESRATDEWKPAVQDLVKALQAK